MRIFVLVWERNCCDSLAALDVQDAIIDGEIVALDEKGRSSFQLLHALPILLQQKTMRFAAAVGVIPHNVALRVDSPRLRK
jgi:hypothetical protein